MGLDFVHVLSPERHYCEFECVVCKRLTSLESYVASACGHPMCKSCCNSDPPKQEECSLCQTPVAAFVNLNEAQPLAYRVLCRVKIACPLRKDHNCSWLGDYKHLQTHVELHHRLDLQKSGKKRKARRNSMKRNSVNKMPSIVESSGNPSREDTLHTNDSIQNEKHELSPGDKVVERTIPHNPAIESGHKHSQQPICSQTPTSDIVKDQHLSQATTKNPHRPTVALSTAAKNTPIPGPSNITRLPLREKEQFHPASEKAMHIVMYRRRSTDTICTSVGSLPRTTVSGTELSNTLPCPPSTKTAKALNEKARHAFQDGSYRDAASLYSQAIQAARNADTNTNFLSSVYANRATALLRLNSFVDSIHDNDEALRLDCKNVKASVHKAFAQIELGRFEEACLSLVIGLEHIPRSFELQQELKNAKMLSQKMKDVRGYHNEEKYAEVLDAINALKVHQSNKHVLLARGYAYLSLDKTSKAIEEANQVLTRDSKNTDAFELRAKARYLDGRLEDSLMDCQTALYINPQLTGVELMFQRVRKVYQLSNNAKNAMRNESYKEAATTYGMTIHASEPLPKSSELYRVLYLARAEAHLEASNYLLALANANLVLKSQHTYVPAWNTKIRAFKAMHRFEELADELTGIMIGDNNWGTEYPFLVDVYDATLDLLNERLSKPAVPDYYAILGVAPDSSIDAIHKMYQLKAMGYDPNKYLAATDAERVDAEDSLQLLQQSMDIVCDVGSRRAYDQQFLGLRICNGY